MPDGAGGDGAAAFDPFRLASQVALGGRPLSFGGASLGASSALGPPLTDDTSDWSASSSDSIANPLNPLGEVTPTVAIGGVAPDGGCGALGGVRPVCNGGGVTVQSVDQSTPSKKGCRLIASIPSGFRAPNRSSGLRTSSFRIRSFASSGNASGIS